MRILVVLNDGNWGGIAVTVYNTLKQFDPTEVYVVFGSEGLAVQEFRKLGLTCTVIEFAGSQIRPGALKALYHVLQRQHIDVVHAHHPRAYLRTRLIARLLGVPHISTPHVPLEEELGQIRGQIVKKALQRARERLLAPWDFFTIALSPHNRMQLIQQGYESHRTRVIANGIDLSRFDPATIEPYQLDFVKDGDLLLGVVGRLAPEKGVTALLEQFCAVPEQINGRAVKLAVVGDGPQRERLEAVILSQGLSGRVLLTGNLLRVERIIVRMDLVLFTSYREALPTILLETLALGKPVIAVDIPAYRSILEDKYGLITQREGFARAIINNLPVPIRLLDMAAAGQRHVRECFAIEDQVQSLKKLYRECLDNTARTNKHV